MLQWRYSNCWGYNWNCFVVDNINWRSKSFRPWSGFWGGFIYSTNSFLSGFSIFERPVSGLCLRISSTGGSHRVREMNEEFHAFFLFFLVNLIFADSTPHRHISLLNPLLALIPGRIIPLTVSPNLVAYLSFPPHRSVSHPMQPNCQLPIVTGH